jgi:Flp pilus assembly protein TadG
MINSSQLSGSKHQVPVIIRICIKLFADIRGSTAVEFALTAPLFVLTILGVMVFGVILSTEALMEGAVRDAARFGVTGQNETERLQIIEDIVSERTIGLVDVDAAQIDVLTYGSFDVIGAPEPFVDAAPYNGVYDPGETYTDINSNAQWDPDQGLASAGQSGEVVLYRITYDAPSMTGFLNHLIGGGDGVIQLVASIAVRNEPYDLDGLSE